jgi:hypothetical protein
MTPNSILQHETEDDETTPKAFALERSDCRSSKWSALGKRVLQMPPSWWQVGFVLGIFTRRVSRNYCKIPHCHCHTQKGLVYFNRETDVRQCFYVTRSLQLYMLDNEPDTEYLHPTTRYKRSAFG